MERESALKPQSHGIGKDDELWVKARHAQLKPLRKEYLSGSSVWPFSFAWVHNGYSSAYGLGVAGGYAPTPVRLRTHQWWTALVILVHRTVVE